MTLLGGLTPRAFLRRHWQKKPLLVRQAVPGFRGFVDVDDLFALAAREDAMARVVVEERKRARSTWHLVEAGASGATIDRDALPDERWTILVQGIESLVPGGWELLRRFAFLPAARVDDLMVSYAAPGGSVGPHVDAYDVFLLQGAGRRRWRIADVRGRTPSFDPHAPIKIITDFVADEDWVLEPGDMLYLPPGIAHWGEAVDACFTYSIGFLAPSFDSIVQNWLVYLGQVLDERMPDGIYSDPDLAPARDPFAVDDGLVRRFKDILRAAAVRDDDVADFAGRLLTGPKPHVAFHPPARPLSYDAFAAALSAGTLALALPTRGLVRGNRVFLNGDAITVNASARRAVHELLTARCLAIGAGSRLPEDVVEAMHAWYRAGWVELRRGARSGRGRGRR